MRRYVFIAATLMAASAYAHVWDELAILARPSSDDTFDLEKYSFLQASTYTNGVFFDYNNDGCLDLLLIGRGGDWNISGNERFCYLYKNLGETEDYRFQRVTDTGLRQATDEGFYNPVSVGDFNHDGYTDLAVMTYDEGRQVTVYLNDHGTGRFIPLDYPLIAATNGSVMFGDLNNDGWLDLAYAGYSDRCATELRTHINNGDGTFSDSTPEMLSGAFQGQMSLGDIDGDGSLDIISCGNGENW
ncbi:MAG: VCBS repeat-containing protein, partial [Muribaculaceae bacterium]|nr:VCBS repeat-containing protein [Muribaculaceae bacterium]